MLTGPELVSFAEQLKTIRDALARDDWGDMERVNDLIWRLERVAGDAFVKHHREKFYGC